MQTWRSLFAPLWGYKADRSDRLQVLAMAAGIWSDRSERVNFWDRQILVLFLGVPRSLIRRDEALILSQKMTIWVS